MRHVPSTRAELIEQVTEIYLSVWEKMNESQGCTESF